MDKLGKNLQKLTEKEQEQLHSILKKLKTGQESGLDIKKLKGHKDIFRARKGSLRIIYQKQDEKIILVMVSRRNEDTYKNF